MHACEETMILNNSNIVTWTGNSIAAEAWVASTREAPDRVGAGGIGATVMSSNGTLVEICIKIVPVEFTNEIEIRSIEKEYSFHLPEQDTPGPWKPELQVQVKEPGVLVHAALTSQLWPPEVAHSLLSGHM